MAQDPASADTEITGSRAGKQGSESFAVDVEDLRGRRREASSSRFSAGKVGDYMTRDPMCLTRDTSLEDAIKILIENRISGVPVVESYPDDKTGRGRLVGVLSEEDVLWKEVRASNEEMSESFQIPYVLSLMTGDSSMLETFEDQALKVLSQTVGLSMSDMPISVTPETSLGEAAQLMLDAKVKRLPVVAPREESKPGFTVVGVLSRIDVLRHVLSILQSERVKDIPTGEGQGGVAS